jgi:hypothetical protein
MFDAFDIMLLSMLAAQGFKPYNRSPSSLAFVECPMYNGIQITIIIITI